MIQVRLLLETQNGYLGYRAKVTILQKRARQCFRTNFIQISLQKNEVFCHKSKKLERSVCEIFYCPVSLTDRVVVFETIDGSANLPRGTHSPLAQLAERRFYTAIVRGSIPLGTTQYMDLGNTLERR